MTKIKLKVVKGNGEYAKSNKIHFNECSPFVENKMAVLVHRPIQMVMHKCLNKPHLAIGYACGLSACGTKKFTFLDDLNESHIVCERCEEKAVKMGYGTSEEICGHHVHIGKTKAVITCCQPWRKNAPN